MALNHGSWLQDKQVDTRRRSVSYRANMLNDQRLHVSESNRASTYAWLTKQSNLRQHYAVGKDTPLSCAFSNLGHGPPPHRRGFRQSRSGTITDYVPGSLTFEKPSKVRFRDNTVDTLNNSGVSCGWVVCSFYERWGWGVSVTRWTQQVAGANIFRQSSSTVIHPRLYTFYSALTTDSGMCFAYVLFPACTWYLLPGLPYWSSLCVSLVCY